MWHVIKTNSIFASKATKTESVLCLLQKPSQFLQGTKIKSIFAKELQKPNQFYDCYKNQVQGTKIELIFAKELQKTNQFYDCYKNKVDFCSVQKPSQFLQASYKNRINF